MVSVKEKVDTKIAGNRVMVFSKKYCGYCRMAKQILDKYLGTGDYEVWEIDNEPDCRELQAYLGKITGAQSVPRVFINGTCIGGGTETEKLHKKGKLRQLLQ